MEWIYKYRKIIMASCVVILFSALSPKLSAVTVSEIETYIPKSHLLAAIMMLVVCCVKSVVMVIPIITVYISAGILFPTGWALLIVYLCLSAELSISYLIGMRMGEKKVDSFIKKNRRASRLLKNSIANNQAACFLTRILPIPFDLASMFFGSSGMPFAKYLGFSLLGLTPNMVPWVVAGKAIDTPLSKEFLIPFGICISITIAVFFVLQKMCKKMKNRRLGSDLDET